MSGEKGQVNGKLRSERASDRSSESGEIGDTAEARKRSNMEKATARRELCRHADKVTNGKRYAELQREIEREQGQCNFKGNMYFLGRKGSS